MIDAAKEKNWKKNNKNINQIKILRTKEICGVARLTNSFSKKHGLVGMFLHHVRSPYFQTPHGSKTQDPIASKFQITTTCFSQSSKKLTPLNCILLHTWQEAYSPLRHFVWNFKSVILKPPTLRHNITHQPLKIVLFLLPLFHPLQT